MPPVLSTAHLQVTGQKRAAGYGVPPQPRRLRHQRAARAAFSLQESTPLRSPGHRGPHILYHEARHGLQILSLLLSFWRPLQLHLCLRLDNPDTSDYTLRLVSSYFKDGPLQLAPLAKKEPSLELTLARRYPNHLPVGQWHHIRQETEGP